MQEQLVFETLFSVESMQALQDEFAAATGVASLITRPDGAPITRPSNFCRLCRDMIRQSEQGATNCCASDARIGQLCLTGPIVQRCHSGGLWDAGAGIAVGGVHVANWLIGQVRDESMTDQELREYAREIGIDADEAAGAFAEIPVMSQQQFAKVAGLLFTVSRQVSDLAYKNLQQSRLIESLQRRERELQESRGKYRALIEQSSDAIVLIDPEKHEIVECNQKFSEWFGYRLPQDAPLSTFKILTDEIEKQDEHYQTLCREGTLPVKRRTFRHKNGSLLFMERSVTLAKNDGRQFVMITYRNIADQLREEQNRKQEAAIARRIQRSQMAELAASPYVEIKTVFESYGEINGDLYHLAWRNEGQLLRGYLVDVPGHGLITALYASILKRLLQEASEQDASLAEQVGWLNHQVCSQFEPDAFAAAIAFELDLQMRELRYVGAGITRFWLDMPPAGSVVQIPGLYLGIDEHHVYGMQTLPVSAGGQVCFATDGLETAALAKEGCGINSCGACCELASELSEAATIKDDIALVCIRVRELPRTFLNGNWPKRLTLNGYEDYRRLKSEVAKVLAEFTGKPHSLQEVAVNEAIANALECRDGKARSQNARIKFSRFGKCLVVRVKTSRIGFAGNAMLKRLRANPDQLFAFGEDASMGRGVPLMLSIAHKMCYNHDGTELLLAWKAR